MSVCTIGKHRNHELGSNVIAQEVKQGVKVSKLGKWLPIVTLIMLVAFGCQHASMLPFVEGTANTSHSSSHYQSYHKAQPVEQKLSSGGEPSASGEPSADREPIVAVHKAAPHQNQKDQVSGQSSSISSVPTDFKVTYQIPDEALNNESDETNEVMVRGGYVCVPEKSSTAATLADILSSGLSEDLSAPVEDDKASKIDPIIPADHPDVEKWERYFRSNKRLFQRYLDRGANYKILVSSVLEEEGLPPELFYLAMVESGFRPAARSSASAVGIWQFISATGKRYGLKVNYYIDERKDPVRATRAASRYLASLYRVYQSWELATAAYNSGENRVLSAIMRGHTRDFWELSRRKLLPRETRDYVPKMMAAIKIGQNLDEYGFTFRATDNYGIPEAAKVPGGVHLKHVSALIGVSQASLKTLNPHLRRNMTPPGGSYKLWVKEKSHSEKIRLSYKNLATNKRVAQKSSSSKVGAGYHLVRRGQTLDSIGKRYNLSIAKLKQLNGIRGSLIYVGQKLKINEAGSAAKSSEGYYVIKKGDTLYSIARKYRTSVRDLKRKNQIKTSRILVGQKIRL